MRWWVLTVSNRRPTPCKGAALPTELSTPSNIYQFKASFRPLPGRNFGTLAFLILIAAPVRGLRPVRAARFPTAKVPKPTKETVPPFFRVVRTAPMVASRARPAAALDKSACLAMCSINSVLFTKNLWVLDRLSRWLNRCLPAQKRVLWRKTSTTGEQQEEIITLWVRQKTLCTR
jgi:hypothetical protein